MTASAFARPGPADPQAGRSRRDLQLGRRFFDALPAIAVFVVVLMAWEVVLGALGIQQFLLPRPSVIAAAFVDQWPVLQKGVIFTATEALDGLAAGCMLALAAAFATSRWAAARESLVPVAVAANAIPIIAFAPITSKWFSSESPLSRIKGRLPRRRLQEGDRHPEREGQLTQALPARCEWPAAWPATPRPRVRPRQAHPDAGRNGARSSRSPTNSGRWRWPRICLIARISPVWNQ